MVAESIIFIEQIPLSYWKAMFMDTFVINDRGDQTDNFKILINKLFVEDNNIEKLLDKYSGAHIAYHIT